MSLEKPAIETASLTWREIEAWALVRIEKWRDRLETAGTSEESTEHTRGQIAALRGLLKLANPPQPIPGTGEDYGLGT